MATKTENNKRIALYTRRTLGEKINVAIDFLRQNWHVALRFSIYLLLPLALIHSVGVFTLVRSITNDNYTSSDISAVFSIIIFVIVSCLIYTLILTLFQYYQGSDDGDLSALTFKDVKGQMWKNLKRILVLLPSILAIAVPLSFIMLVSLVVPFISLFVFVGYSIMMFIVMLVPIYYILENCKVRDAYGRSFSHARESLGKLIGLMFALLLVVSIISTSTSMPMVIFLFVTEQLIPSGQLSRAVSLSFDIILYVFVIIQTFFSYLSMALVVTTLVFHYGSNAREQDDLAIAVDIENFENL